MISARDRPITAQAVILLAKEPVPGRVKTRLQAEFSAAEAADLAACAIEDTLRAVRSSRAPRKVLAWKGSAARWEDEFELHAQPEGTLNERLASAFAAVLRTAPSTPALLIGMDTPQVTAGLLDTDWEGADAVLGLSDDGGFWAVGLRSVDPRGVFTGIPMSTGRTGGAQLARLLSLGLSVKLLPPLRDIDLPDDAEDVARRHPELTFSRRHRELMRARREQGADRLFDCAFTGEDVVAHSTADAFPLDVRRWRSTADEVDQMVVSRCEPPVLDLGCGPGRMVAALNESGRSALGVDISAVAVTTSLSRGGLALRRSINERLPAEGRWGTALLMDSNVGIGGDLSTLLQRCCDLVGAGGLVICEVDPVPDRHEVNSVVLTSAESASVPLLWARVGARTLARAAARLDLLVTEEWSAGGRAFVTLRKN